MLNPLDEFTDRHCTYEGEHDAEVKRQLCTQMLNTQCSAKLLYVNISQTKAPAAFKQGCLQSVGKSIVQVFGIALEGDRRKGVAFKSGMIRYNPSWLPRWHF